MLQSNDTHLYNVILKEPSLHICRFWIEQEYEGIQTISGSSVIKLILESPGWELEIFVEEEILDEPGDHLLLGEIPENVLIT